MPVDAPVKEEIKLEVQRSSLLDASRALLSTWTYERILKVHTTGFIITIALGFAAGYDALHWAIYAMSITILLSSELANSAVERLADSMVGQRFHNLAKEAKDIAAGAVVSAAFIAICVQVILLVSSPALKRLGLALLQ